MNISKISVRYAKALFESALEQKCLEPVRKDMEQLYSASHNEKLKVFLESPVIKDSEKRKTLKTIFEKEFNPLSISFIDLVAKNKRETYLRDIARNFIDRYKKYKGIKTASLKTATAIDDSTRKKIQDLIRTELNTTVEMDESIEPDLIGGFILTIEDQQLDSSLSTKLAKVRRELLNASFEKKI